MDLEKLKEVEEKAKSMIQAIQEQIDAAAEQMATRNEEHRKEMKQLEVAISVGNYHFNVPSIIFSG